MLNKNKENLKQDIFRIEINNTYLHCTKKNYNTA